MVTEVEIHKAAKRGSKHPAMVRAVRYHPDSDKLELTMEWCTLLVDRKHIEEFKDVSKTAMEGVYLSPEGIHLDDADIDINAAGLIAALAQQLAEQALKAA